MQTCPNRHLFYSAQGGWLQDPARWVVQLFDVALGAQGISAVLLHSINGMNHHQTAGAPRINSLLREQAGLDRHYLIRIYIGFGLLIASYVIVMANLFLACRPFHNYWQINPDPGSQYFPPLHYNPCRANCCDDRCVPACRVKPSHLGLLCLQRFYRLISHIHSCPHAVQSNSPALEESRPDCVI